MEQLILASSSPRRKMLLEQIGIKFEIIPSSIDEDNYGGFTDCAELVKKLSDAKACNVVEKMTFPCIVIGADTLVVKDGILSKPRSVSDAADMLKKLSGQWHEVFTGIAVVSAPSMKKYVGYECTKVKFRDISNDEIHAYIRTGEPMDKAAAYAIQGMGSIFVERIEGCYTNIVGLPIPKLTQALKDFGVNIL